MTAGDAARPTRLGRYELITRIGQGGMAEVQLALQRGPAGFEKLVVVKLVHNNLASQKSFVDMLLDEARVAALVKHPNVVDIYDLGQADGRFFIAMEYLEGEPLLAVLRAGREGKRLDPLSTGRLIADTAEGLDAAHELRSMAGERLELVHHDISLGNIVVLYNGQVKLVDFGVAKATSAAGAKGKVQGKFSYMAPEKLQGSQGDRRSDIFSLGCVMWESLTLKRLFRGGNDAETMKQVLEARILPPSKINGDVAPEFDAIVMKALARDLNDRYTNAKVMAVEIEEVLRKRGYGAKNDKIAKYMQETFKGHIDARKKLVQEVVAKGSASAEVLDAAFSGPEIASGSPATPVPGADFGKLGETPLSGVPAATAAWADSSSATQISAPPVMDDGPTTPRLPPPRGPALKAASAPVSARPSTELDVDAVEDTLAPTGSGRTTIDVPPIRDVDGTGELSPLRDTQLAKPIGGIERKWLYLGTGAGALLLIVIIAVASSGGDKPNTPTVAAAGTGSQIASASGSDDRGSALGSDTAGSASDAAGSGSAMTGSDSDSAGSGSDSAGSGSGSAGSGSGSAKVIDFDDDTSKAGSGSGSGPGSGRRPPGGGRPAVVVEKIDVEATVNKALQSFVKGDAKGALGLLQKARVAKPGYAPTYRVLGRVYKKLGDNAKAKNAFQRYLALSPRAADASQIKGEISKL